MTVRESMTVDQSAIGRIVLEAIQGDKAVIRFEPADGSKAQTHTIGVGQDIFLSRGVFTKTVRRTKYVMPDDVMMVTDGATPEASKDALRALMKKHGLTGAKVAEIVGVNSRTVRKWTGGERGIPKSAWRLLLVATGELGKRDD